MNLPRSNGTPWERRVGERPTKRPKHRRAGALDTLILTIGWTVKLKFFFTQGETPDFAMIEQQQTELAKREAAELAARPKRETKRVTQAEIDESIAKHYQEVERHIAEGGDTKGD